MWKELELTIETTEITLSKSIVMVDAKILYTMKLHPLDVTFGAEVKMSAMIHKHTVDFVGEMAAKVVNGGAR